MAIRAQIAAKKASDNAAVQHQGVHPHPLDLDKLNYNSWSSLFKRFCKAYDVLHHLDASSSSTSAANPLYESNDSLVVMWIYSTISPKLVDMIVDDSATASSVWKRLTESIYANLTSPLLLYT
ncbi:hypothetical protein CTI12_AA174010 [Artemisia annua]|uniref:Hybrid signal transduction histidine kinase M n=1 Tax=Artemisia annua TaxID=35608 RepID=A0A2U1PA26_ARTAN|nr:hypothetical protein CTI12_AA174010 [Artemisia annua]